MDRRRFLIGSATALLGAGCDRLTALAGGMVAGEPTPVLHRPGMVQGHLLRDARALPQPTATLRTEIAILGSGAAGVAAAWQLARAGHRDFVLLDGPEPFGNAAAGAFGSLRYPRGAHYLPLASPESTHVREMLADTGLIVRDANAAAPYYDESAIVHAPEARVLHAGKWHEGLVPLAALDAGERAQLRSFEDAMHGFERAAGADGRRAFAVPSARSSADPELLALDRESLRQWLRRRGLHGRALHWYVDYCCRDDYGIDAGETSAWAGLHYFASRGATAQNAAEGAVLTWPEGLHALLAKLAERIDARQAGRAWRKPGMALAIDEAGQGARVRCVHWPSGPSAAPQGFALEARRVICATPLAVAARLLPLSRFGLDPSRDLPAASAWLVGNFHLRGVPSELAGAPLSWDNVVYGSDSLGYVVSTHQWIRQSRPLATVLTAYHPVTDRAPSQARRWLLDAPPAELLSHCARDLLAAYGRRFFRHVAAVEITLRAHAMAAPQVGFLQNRARAVLREVDGSVLFAHSDLAGFSLFEEAAFWGERAALRALA